MEEFGCCEYGIGSWVLGVRDSELELGFGGWKVGMGNWEMGVRIWELGMWCLVLGARS